MTYEETKGLRLIFKLNIYSSERLVNFENRIKLGEIKIIKIERPKYEVVEEIEEIDIDKITYFDEVRDLSTWSNETLSDNQRSILNKIRELIKAVKQLNKKIKE